MKPLVMLAAVATSALLLIPTVTSAQTLASANVSYNDLDLTVTADRAKLDARLSRTIDKLCAEPGMRGADRRAMENFCIASAKSSIASFQLASNAKRRSPHG
jgi:UrcA family protein